MLLISYIYNQKKQNINSINWKCEERTCKGSCTTPLTYNNNTIPCIGKIHHHGPDILRKDIIIVKNGIKEKSECVNYSSINSRQIINGTLSGKRREIITNAGTYSTIVPIVL